MYNVVPCKNGKIYISTQESFYLQGILNYINEQDTFIRDCKRNHMQKSGAPPDKVRGLYRLLPIEFGSWSYLIFRVVCVNLNET